MQGRGSRRPAPHTDRMRTSSRRAQRAQRACMSVHLSAFCKRSNLSRIPAASRAGPRGGGRTGSASTPASGTYPPDEPVVNGRPLTSGRSGRERDFHLFESACERGGGAARSKNAGKSISGQGPPLRRNQRTRRLVDSSCGLAGWAAGPRAGPKAGLGQHLARSQGPD